MEETESIEGGSQKWTGSSGQKADQAEAQKSQQLLGVSGCKEGIRIQQTQLNDSDPNSQYISPPDTPIGLDD
ncbi:hypothetical protein C922_04695 [Plasmodium inui San Antonio 1]|uniref:Uncharacterized protein n=1 Tax=Plasmodium inui San Antonio 1 TaxID=1237626 RepID=W7A0A0_9APIC|nr:hypothetical protein C922_04695 [Plasmodium inui San Antonio 1]EUD64963.1 hypothetical protein C922_04695 [Plasmodium inui San Antonio 1]